MGTYGSRKWREEASKMAQKGEHYYLVRMN